MPKFADLRGRRTVLGRDRNSPQFKILTHSYREMAALVRGRFTLILGQTPGASTSQCRAFRTTAPALAGKTGGAKGKKVQVGKKGGSTLGFQLGSR